MSPGGGLGGVVSVGPAPVVSTFPHLVPSAPTVGAAGRPDHKPMATSFSALDNTSPPVALVRPQASKSAQVNLLSSVAMAETITGKAFRSGRTVTRLDCVYQL